MDNVIPKVRLRANQRPKWISSKLKHKQNCLRTLQKKYIQSPTERKAERIAHLESYLNEALVAAKTEYESDLASHNTNSQKLYNYIKNLQKLKTNTTHKLHLDDVYATTDLEKATLFNQYFHSVFTQSILFAFLQQALLQIQSCINDVSISESEVYTALSSLNPSKYTGPDGIGPKILKFCGTFLPFLHK